MDNITHSLFGAALAELAQPATLTPRQRRVFITAGVAAANLPDLDLVYTWITPPPLGYLLHHRGHTHTVAGLAALAVALALAFRAWPAARESLRNWPGRLWGLIAINLAGHVSLDAFNSYGVHPFYPFDAHWYYGDAVFIFEPLIWVLLGTAAVCNARGRTPRTTLGVGVSTLLVLVSIAGIVPLRAIAAVAVAGGLFFAAVRSVRPRTRSVAALALTMLFMAGMSMLSRLAKSTAHASVTAGTEVVDVIVTPDPAMPVCWSVIVLARDPRTEELRTSRGTLSLSAAWYPPDRCASYRLTGVGTPGTQPAGEKIAWRDDFRQSLAELRDISGGDCWVRAWLQFGRAPVLRGGAIVDLRFESGVRANFTAMPLAREPGARCPTNLPGWVMPRRDLVSPLH